MDISKHFHQPSINFFGKNQVLQTLLQVKHIHNNTFTVNYMLSQNTLAHVTIQVKMQYIDLRRIGS